jgi:hypothetical protein
MCSRVSSRLFEGAASLLSPIVFSSGPNMKAPRTASSCQNWFVGQYAISDMNGRPLVQRPSRTRPIARSESPSFSSDNPIPAFVAFLAEDAKVAERTARQYVADLQRPTAWLDPALPPRSWRRPHAPCASTRLSSASVKAVVGQRRMPAGWGIS